MSAPKAEDSDAESRSITVLEFGLDSRRWCMEIEQVVEIVRKGPVTSIPDAPPHVEGVVDLRGETTRVIDPTQLLDFDGDSSKEMVIVLESENDHDGPVGWLVDAVYRVRRLSTDALDESVGSGAVKGVFAEDGHITWVDPDGDFGT